MRLREHALRILGRDPGCSDNNCVWGSWGVGTNGGCKCYDQKQEIWTRKSLLDMSTVAKQLAREVSLGYTVKKENDE